MFEKELGKAQAKGSSVATIRKDIAKKLVASDKVQVIRCRYHYTDDYAWDAANDFGRGQTDSEFLLQEMDTFNYGLKCWVSADEPNKMIVRIHSNYCFEVVFGEEPQPTKEELPSNVVLFNPNEPATKRQLWALHCITKLDTRDMKITKKQASQYIEMAKTGEDIKPYVTRANVYAIQ